MAGTDRKTARDFADKGADLDRRFRPVTEREANRGQRYAYARAEGRLDWDYVLGARRVVILAEAGSGKSHEFEQCHERLLAEGRPACIAAVQDVGRLGLAEAMSGADASRLAAWRASEDGDCIFLIDSVDEAKDAGISFAAALRAIAKGIEGLETRAVVIISGRFSDWDFTADRKALDKLLAVPQKLEALPDEDYRELVRGTVGHRAAPPPKAGPRERVEILIMTPLDAERIRRFASQSGIHDTDAFLEAIDGGNLWHFASRPLDLDWMAAFWRKHGRLGTLAEMLETSVLARLADPRDARRRVDSISRDEAWTALERIGAAMQFGQRETVHLPGAPQAASEDGGEPIELETLLPDWPQDKLLSLLGRAIFDPATLGRVRLHNDNEGTVRAWLAARWMRSRLAAGSPLESIAALLFGDLYGHRLVRPGLAEAAAWLALWEPRIADMLIERAPAILLMRGDPGSLPAVLRVRAIDAALAAEEFHDPWIYAGETAYRRLSHPVLDSAIPGWWANYRDDESARHLILRIVWLARQTGGTAVARNAAFDTRLDDISRLLGMRALLAIGDPEDRSAVADHVRTNAASMPRHMLLGALATLFPSHLDTAEFFAAFDSLAADKDRDDIHPLGAEPLDWGMGVADPEAFIVEVAARLGPFGDPDEPHPIANAFDTMAAGAALHLVQNSEGVPEAATELVLKLHAHTADRGIGSVEQDLREALVATTERRRMSFWQAAKLLADHPWVKDAELGIWQIEHLGWPDRMGDDDVEWLLEDIKLRELPADRNLALETLGKITNNFKDRRLLRRVRASIVGDAALERRLADILTPQPASPERRSLMAKMHKRRRENQKRTARRDGSWIRFVASVRDDPSVFARLNPTTAETVDTRLYNVWRLLCWRTPSSNRHAIEDLAAIEPLLGKEATEAFGKALIDFAHAFSPLLARERPEADRNLVYQLDGMGLAGMSLDAQRPGWAVALTPAQADKAVRYAILEFGSLPPYIADLARAHPAIVRDHLAAEIDEQIARGSAEAYGMLDRLTQPVLPEIAELMAPILTDRLARMTARNETALLGKLVGALLPGIAAAPARLAALVARRAACRRAPAAAAQYFTLAFALNGDAAIAALAMRLDDFNKTEQEELGKALLVRLYSSRFSSFGNDLQPELSFSALRALLGLAYRMIRQEDDIVRKSGVVYSPTMRDHAQDARGAILTRFANTPGEATHAALLELGASGELPVEADWLSELARQRATGDAALPAWDTADILGFERHHEKVPATNEELLALVLGRIASLGSELLDGRFQQGTTLRGLPDENEVQRWLGDRFELMRREAYTVEREPHSADEKEPDLLITGRRGAVALPVEIKVANSWSVADLEAALTDQLCGRYLRGDGRRHGILLLVCQTVRQRGWTIPGNAKPAGIVELMRHLEARAEGIRKTDPRGPQPVVALLDVSTVRSNPKDYRKSRG